MKSRIAEIEARLRKATPGKWGFDEYWETVDIVSKADADFIAHAPEDLCFLLDYVAALENKLESANRVISALMLANAEEEK